MNTRIKKPIRRIAVFGGGAHTIPSYRALLNNLSYSFKVVIYSEFPIYVKFDAQYLIRSVPYKRPSRWILAGWFLIRFGLDHLLRPFDVIHSHSTYPSGRFAILFKRMFKIPVVLCLNAAEAVGIESIQFGALLNPVSKAKNAEVIKKADVVTALTQFQANDIKEVFLRTDLQVIARGIDITKFQTVNSVDFSKDEVIFLHVGYLHPVKDPIMLINCFHLISKSIKCRLIQVGPDYMNGQVQQYATELGISNLIDFYGFVPHEKIYSFFQRANVLLHTSIFESQAFVVNEALVHGLLICGTKVGLLSDLDGQCCVTAPTEDFEGLAKKVLQALDDRAFTARLIENGLKWSQKYDLQWTTSCYKEIYLELLNK